LTGEDVPRPITRPRSVGVFSSAAAHERERSSFSPPRATSPPAPRRPAEVPRRRAARRTEPDGTGRNSSVASALRGRGRRLAPPTAAAPHPPPPPATTHEQAMMIASWEGGGGGEVGTRARLSLSPAAALSRGAIMARWRPAPPSTMPNRP
ncbi:hypothetical protein GQ55_4G062400, partial [Panicum hallii var. hallii]